MNLEEELEVLQSIYMDDIAVTIAGNGSTKVQTTVLPSTADDINAKFVCITICFMIPLKYPDVSPAFEVSQPRGLSEAHVGSIIDNLKTLIDELLGEAMLFQLIEYVKESLSDNNKPTGSCAICLEHFKPDDQFLRTTCYHYFHMACFGMYAKSKRDSSKDTNEKLVCPVCRVDVSGDQAISEALALSQVQAVEHEKQSRLELPSGYREWQRKCALMFEKQKRAGGIIDIEAEQKRFLIDSTTTLTNDGSVELSRDTQFAEAVSRVEHLRIDDRTRNDAPPSKKRTNTGNRNRRSKPEQKSGSTEVAPTTRRVVKDKGPTNKQQIPKDEKSHNRTNDSKPSTASEKSTNRRRRQDIQQPKTEGRPNNVKPKGHSESTSESKLVRPPPGF